MVAVVAWQWACPSPTEPLKASYQDCGDPGRQRAPMDSSLKWVGIPALVEWAAQTLTGGTAVWLDQDPESRYDASPQLCPMSTVTRIVLNAQMGVGGGLMGERTNGQMDEWVDHVWMDARQMNWWRGELIGRWWADGFMHVYVEKGALVGRWEMGNDVWMGGCVGGWLVENEWMDEWWMNKLMDG